MDAKLGVINRNQPDTDNINFWDGNNPISSQKGKTGVHIPTGKSVLLLQPRAYYYCGSINYYLPDAKWCDKKLDKGIEYYTLRFTLNRNSKSLKTERWCKECWETNREFFYKMKFEQEQYQRDKKLVEQAEAAHYSAAPLVGSRKVEDSLSLTKDEATRRRRLTVYFNNYKLRALRFTDALSEEFSTKVLNQAYRCQNKIIDMLVEIETIGGAPKLWADFSEWFTNELTKYEEPEEDGKDSHEE